MVVARLCLYIARRRGAPESTFVGKVNAMRVLCAALAATRVTARCAIALSMESCLVALSTESGEGLSGWEHQSTFITIRHRGAIK